MEDGLDEEQNVCNHGRKTFFFQQLYFFRTTKKYSKFIFEAKWEVGKGLIGLDKCT